MAQCMLYAFVLALAALVVPPDSMKKKPYSEPRPSRMKAVIGWVNATTDLTAENADGYVILYTMQVVGFDAEGNETLLAEDDYSEGTCSGGVWTRGPEVGEEGWFVRKLPGEAKDYFTAVRVVTVEGGEKVRRWAVKLPTGRYPRNVLHVWGGQWPRAHLPPTIVRVETRVDLECVGAALAQVGERQIRRLGCSFLTLDTWVLLVLRS